MIKKLVYVLVSLLLGFATFLTGFSLNLLNKVQPPLSGIVSDQPTISATAIRSVSTACGTNATGTVITAADSSRTSWISSLVNGGSGSAYLCRNATCTQGIGIIIVTSSPVFEQSDGYVGPYSCIGASVTTTVTTVYSVGN